VQSKQNKRQWKVRRVKGRKRKRNYKKIQSKQNPPAWSWY
jgi:hypothetical protein